MKRRIHQGFRAVAITVALGLATAGNAQTVVTTKIRVNDQAITQYEINQRAQLLQLFRAPGDPHKLAREQLIEDRLKMDAARANGITLEEPEIEAGMQEFAERTGMQAEDLIRGLEAAGVTRATFRDFVRSGVTWREVTRARFANRTSVSEGDIDRAKAAASDQGGVRVLLSELIMVAPPEQYAAVMERAESLSNIHGAAQFSAAARQYSAAETRERGGQMNWMSLSDLPPQLRAVILTLSPGEVSDPLPLEGAVALFQLRDIEEVRAPAPSYTAIEYAVYQIAGGQSAAAQKTAAGIRGRVNNCDDLYGIAKGQPPEVLQRLSQAPDQIPANIRYELAKLDDGEISTTLTTPGGAAMMLIMMCGRTLALPEGGPSDEDLGNFIRNQRIESYANSYLAQLRAEARIVEK